MIKQSSLRSVASKFDVLANGSKVGTKKGKFEPRFDAGELIENVPVLIWIIDRSGKCIFLSRQWEEYTGKKVEDYLNSHWIKLFHREDREGLKLVVEELINSQSGGVAQSRIRNKFKTYDWFLIRMVPLKDKSGKIDKWLGTNTNIQYQKDLERRKDEFLSIASHELKTPLSSIKGYTQILSKMIDKIDLSMIKVILEKQDLSINRLNILISDLLDITRLNAGKMQFNKAFVDFDAIINESVDSSRPLSETHRIIVHGKANAQIYADRQRLNQVLTNLIANAIKYSPQADSVVVRVKKTGNLVKVAVVDHGIGIPAAEQLKVFQQFYRCQKTAKHYPGLGIGLYISREIIRKHKGEIWFESQENKGSVFYFKIPIRRSSHGKNSNL